MTSEQRRHYKNMADLVLELSRATRAVLDYWWDNDLPSDFSDETSGYPYHESLEGISRATFDWWWALKKKAEEGSEYGHR